MYELLRRHVRSVLFITMVLTLIGAYTVSQMPVSIFPRLTIPRIMIAAEGGDAPASTVAVTVTRPMEAALSSIPNLQLLQSQTIRGAASFTLTFGWGSDLQTALQRVNAQIADIRGSLPPGLNITAEILNPTIFPILDYSLTSSTRSTAELRILALYTLRPRIARLPGVQRVLVNGGDQLEYQVNVSPAQLAAYGLTIGQVEDALTRSNTLSAAGAYVDHYQRHLVVVNGLLTGPDSIAQVVVTTRNRTPVTVGDLATVEEAYQRQQVIATGNGRPAVLMNIIRQPNGNTIEVAKEVAAMLRDARSTLPPDVKIHAFYDQSQLVQEAENSVVEAILVGGALALAVLMLFLKSVRSALTAVALLPLTLVITFGVMKAAGLDLNIMTLGGLAIALGMVIDDSIVVVEHVYHHLEQGLPRSRAIVVGMREITPAMVSSSAASIVTFVPLIFLPGVTGNFFSALAITMIGALAVSLGVALFVFPSIALWSFPETVRSRSSGEHRDGRRREQVDNSARPFENPVVADMNPETGARDTRLRESSTDTTDINDERERSGDGEPHLRHGRHRVHPTPMQLPAFGRLTRLCVRRRWLILLLLIPLGVGSYFGAQSLQTGFMPEFDEGAIVLDYKMPAGASLEETNRVLQQVEGILAHQEGVASWSRLAGAQSGTGLEITPQNQGDINIRLTRGKRPSVDEIISDIRTKIAIAVPNMNTDFGQIVSDLIGDLAGGAAAPVEVKVFGPDMGSIQTTAAAVASSLGKIKGLVDIQTGIVMSDPETQVRVDPVLAGEHGLSPDAVTTAARAALYGDETGTVLKGEIQEPVRVRYPGPTVPAMDAATLGNTPISNGAGQLVPLALVSNIESLPGEPNLNRENQRLLVSVTARLQGLDLGTAINLVKRQLSALPLPPGVDLEYGGLYKSQQQSFHDLAVVLGLTALFAATVLILAFRSFRTAAALLGAAILSLSGVVLALAITGTPLNISSYTGAIMVVGIVVENGVLLFDELQRRQRSAPEAPLEDQLGISSVARLRPILMMKFASILTLLPLSFGIGAGAAMQKPLAIAVIGGVGLSVFFTLLVAPVLYAVLTDLKGLLRPH